MKNIDALLIPTPDKKRVITNITNIANITVKSMDRINGKSDRNISPLRAKSVSTAKKQNRFSFYEANEFDKSTNPFTTTISGKIDDPELAASCRGNAKDSEQTHRRRSSSFGETIVAPLSELISQSESNFNVINGSKDIALDNVSNNNASEIFKSLAEVEKRRKSIEDKMDNEFSVVADSLNTFMDSSVHNKDFDSSRKIDVPDNVDENLNVDKKIQMYRPVGKKFHGYGSLDVLEQTDEVDDLQSLKQNSLARSDNTPPSRSNPMKKPIASHQGSEDEQNSSSPSIYECNSDSTKSEIPLSMTQVGANSFEIILSEKKNSPVKKKQNIELEYNINEINQMNSYEFALNAALKHIRVLSNNRNKVLSSLPSQCSFSSHSSDNILEDKRKGCTTADEGRTDFSSNMSNVTATNDSHSLNKIPLLSSIPLPLFTAQDGTKLVTDDDSQPLHSLRHPLVSKNDIMTYNDGNSMLPTVTKFEGSLLSQIDDNQASVKVYGADMFRPNHIVSEGGAPNISLASPVLSRSSSQLSLGRLASNVTRNDAAASTNATHPSVLIPGENPKPDSAANVVTATDATRNINMLNERHLDEIKLETSLKIEKEVEKGVENILLAVLECTRNRSESTDNERLDSIHKACSSLFGRSFVIGETHFNNKSKQPSYNNTADSINYDTYEKETMVNPKKKLSVVDELLAVNQSNIISSLFLERNRELGDTHFTKQYKQSSCSNNADSTNDDYFEEKTMNKPNNAMSIVDEFVAENIDECETVSSKCDLESIKSKRIIENNLGQVPNKSKSKIIHLTGKTTAQNKLEKHEVSRSFEEVSSTSSCITPKSDDILEVETSKSECFHLPFDSSVLGKKYGNKVLGRLSKEMGGTTGVVLNEDDNSLELDEGCEVPSPSLMDPIDCDTHISTPGSLLIKSETSTITNGPNEILTTFSGDLSQCSSSNTSGSRQDSEKDEPTTREIDKWVRELYAHILPKMHNKGSTKRGIRGWISEKLSRSESFDLSVNGHEWDDEDPDETGYIIHRISQSQLCCIEQKYEQIASKVKQKTEEVQIEISICSQQSIIYQESQHSTNTSDEKKKKKNTFVGKIETNEPQSPSTYDMESDCDESRTTSSSALSLDESEHLDMHNILSLNPLFPNAKPAGNGKVGDLEIYHLPIIYKAHQTGFEPTKDLVLQPKTIFSGQYYVQNELGTAAFSTTYRCVDLNSGKKSDDGEAYYDEVCLKVIKNTKDFFDQSLDEIKILELLRQTGKCQEHNILEMQCFFYHKEHLIIVTELLRQNLFEFGKYIIENNEPTYFSRDRLCYISRQCLISLKFIHKLGLVHSDIKPENILLASYSKAKVKVIDFGSSCYLTDRQSSYIQSRSYRAPEVILGLPYDGKIDVWSLGCVIAEMYTGQVTFQNDSVVSMLSRIEAICGSFPQHMIQKGKHSSQFFTSTGLLYEGVENEEDDDSRVNKIESRDEAFSRDQNEAFFNIFQPKVTTIASRLGIDPGLMDKNTSNFVDFLSKILEIDPKSRLSAEEALEHPWILSSYNITEQDILYPPEM